MGKDILVPRKLPSRGFYFRFRQWGVVPNNTKVVALPISYTKFKTGIGMHVGASSINVIGLSDYFSSLNQIGFSTFSPDGKYSAYAAVYWIALGC